MIDGLTLELIKHGFNEYKKTDNIKGESYWSIEPLNSDDFVLYNKNKTLKSFYSKKIKERDFMLKTLLSI